MEQILLPILTIYPTKAISKKASRNNCTGKAVSWQKKYIGNCRYQANSNVWQPARGNILQEGAEVQRSSVIRLGEMWKKIEGKGKRIGGKEFNDVFIAENLPT